MKTKKQMTIGEQIREDRIERGAKALREHQMKGRFTRPWEQLQPAQKRKWIEAVTIVYDTFRLD